MTNQVIPAQAIEAAARAAYDQVRPLMGFPSDFEEAPEPIQETYRGITRAALEAAAPHIRAQALEDAADDTADDELGYPTVELWLRALATNERSSL